MKANPLYRRVLLKISGEGLMGPSGTIDPSVLNRLAAEIKSVHEMGVQVCVVVGGGNIFRGVALASHGMNRSTGDYIGMLATIMNAMALQEAIEKMGMEARVQSALPVAAVAEPFIRRRALRHLEKGRVVIFAGGTGNPFFTTDTAAVLRAVELECGACLKSTQVDGVYDADPKLKPKAKRYDRISYDDVLVQKLKVMDVAAIEMAQNARLPIIVFNQSVPGAFKQVIEGVGKFTLIGE